jgi:hypothetical protein
VTNAGTATLSITNISYPPGFSGVVSATVPAGGSINVTVTFSPTAIIIYGGSVTVNSDAVNGSGSIPVSGYGGTGNLILTVLTHGDGTVAPKLSGKLLKAGRKYTLTAIAAPGNVFTNWTGSISTNRNPLTFAMEVSTLLQANFIPNPFLPVRGTYNGLFFATNGVTEQTAGMLRGLIVGTTGAYSGALIINGAGHPISGKFNLSGQATNKISRPASQGGALLLEMTLDWNDSPPQITGSVFGTNNGVPWMANNLTADLAATTPGSAEYTMLIPPDTNTTGVLVPGGVGYALISTHTSTARITGALADGTAVSQSVPVSLTGNVPIFANLYTGKGLLLGWINLDSTNDDGAALAWVHPAIRTGLFTDAFISTNLIALSPWTNPPAMSALPTNLDVFEMVDGLTTLTNEYVVTVSNNFRLGEVSGPTLLSGSINPKTGLLTVTFTSGKSKITGTGAILLNATNGGGYFLTRTNSGSIILGQ